MSLLLLLRTSTLEQNIATIEGSACSLLTRLGYDADLDAGFFEIVESRVGADEAGRRGVLTFGQGGG